jgi:hypothetical protein
VGLIEAIVPNPGSVELVITGAVETTLDRWRPQYLGCW